MLSKLQKNRTIILPIGKKKYHQIVNNKVLFAKTIISLQAQYPEIFPVEIQHGFSFVGYSKNDKKIAIPRRIIRLKNPLNQYADYLLHPCFIFPYLKANTKQVAKGLFLRKYNVPYHAIAEQYGKNSMYWYRAELTLAQCNIVGTSIKRAANLPKHLLVDEHHTNLLADKIYVCTTIGNNCFLGAAISSNMLSENLKKAYGQFQQETQQIFPDYHPKTINIDGYKSTKKAMQELYLQTAILRCFLHAFIKIRNCGTKAYELYFRKVADQVWYCYHAESKRGFAQRISYLQQWTQCYVPSSPFKNAILKLCEKKRIYRSF